MMKKEKIFTGISTLILIGMIFLLCTTIRLLGDDLWYYSFARHGIHHFVECMKSHYDIENGRELVHGVLAIILALPNIWFSVAFIFLFIVITIGITMNVVKDNIKINSVANVFIMGISLFLLMGNQVISDAVLWLSGAFNYLIPMTILLGYLFCLKRRKYFGALLLGILSSYTTELYSLLTLILSIVVFFRFLKEKKEDVGKEKLIFGLVMIISHILGLCFLFSSPGIQIRFLNSEDEIGLIHKSLILMTTFSQMSLEKDGLACILWITSVLVGVHTCFKINKKAVGYFSFFVSFFFLLSIFWVVFDAWICMTLLSTFFIILVWYGIILIKHKNNDTVLMALITLLISFGVICVSGEATFRMLFVPSFCMLCIALNAYYHLDNNKGKSLIVIGILIFALTNSIDLYIIRNHNAHIWDENQNTLVEYNGNGLVLKPEYDENYFMSAFQRHFVGWYFHEFGISKETEYSIQDNKSFFAVDKDGNIISDDVIIRRGDYYIYCRELAKLLEAEVNWKYGTANLYYQSNQYRLKSGIYAVLTGEIGGKSIKLSAPIRSIEDKIYFPVQDVEKVFNYPIFVKEYN